MVERGMPLTRVRKICQGIAFLGPAACMVGCALLTPYAIKSTAAAAATQVWGGRMWQHSLALGLGVAEESMCLYVAHEHRAAKRCCSTCNPPVRVVNNFMVQGVRYGRCAMLPCPGARFATDPPSPSQTVW
eukprot:1156455-Pelagomonas_calceolata.AAC.1